jgi:hypothetical protein
MDNADITERLRATGTPLDGPSLNRTLARLRRNGWLKKKGSSHSITTAGRKALRLAASALKDLIALTTRT